MNLLWVKRSFFNEKRLWKYNEERKERNDTKRIEYSIIIEKAFNVLKDDYNVELVKGDRSENYLLYIKLI